MAKLLIFTMHRTTPWWKYIASHLECFDDVTVLSDIRGDGDLSVVDAFYRNMRCSDASASVESALGVESCNEIIRRCRTLRCLDRSLAMRMIGGMWRALEDVLTDYRPNLILSFTIDRYVMDLLERVGRRHGIQFLEMTASILSNRIMFLQRGRLISVRTPANLEIRAAIDELVAPTFVPSYVEARKRFSLLNFARVYIYFELRSMAFNILRWIQRDPLNLHYLDAQKRLTHKVRISDWIVLRFMDKNWRSRLEARPKSKRVFLGLQLFPEASLDYWLKDIDLLAHDETVLEICRTLGNAGFFVFVKDHPLQFGFRQRELLESLQRMQCVTLVPYEVSAAELLSHCGLSVTFTGTIGFQAAMSGLISVVSDPYYSTPDHFVHFHNREDIKNLPKRIEEFSRKDSLEETRLALVRKLLSASMPGDYFSFRNFDSHNNAKQLQVQELIKSLNSVLPNFLYPSTDDSLTTTT